MKRALEQMPRLKSFSWGYRRETLIPLGPPGPNDRHFPPVIFDVLQHLGSVEHFRLNIYDSFKFNEPVEQCGLWKMAQLRSLLVTGRHDYWPSTLRSNAAILVNWLNSLSSLELLHLPPGMLEEHHAALFFPNLRRLKLSTSDFPRDISGKILDFLGRHQAIEELVWDSRMFPPTHFNHPPDFLPNLRRFDGQYPFLLALISQTEINLLPPRKFESLALGWYPDADHINKLCTSSGIDHQALRFLSLSVHQTIRDVHDLATAFPMIEELSLPSVDRGEASPVGEFLSGLELLKNLKALYRDVIWCDLGIRKGGSDLDLHDPDLQLIVDERIQTFARRCPNLIQVTHPKVYDWFIEIGRDNGEVLTRILPVPRRSRFEIQYYGFW
ncbi:hypothetical protein BDN72DRAFT_530818 [Pluteus cervinus]|uniref:Uncharacterized protein n=1 Tax=Pluteus cervinus TaxID=181527 RepID=A0ACD3A4U2_9AGAR|nr:hypothetical protein BDN72DRAFT_530818 [Pluteus cervinus]